MRRALEGRGLLGIGNGGLVDGNEVTIWSTGVLMGEGTLRAGTVRNHGIIRPGASIGTLTVDGDLSLESDSTLEVEIDNAGNSDKLIVTGAFSFETGSVSVVPTETIVGEQEYLVVEAYSVEWPTSGVGQLSTALLHAHLVPRLRLLTDPNGIELHVTAIAFDDASVARTENQRSLGSALNQIAEGGGNDLTMTLQQLQTGDEVRRAYDQLSGQTTPSLAPVTVAGGTRHVGMIAGRLRSAADWFSRDIGLGESSDRLVSGTDSVGIDAGQYLFAAGNGSPVLGDRPWGVWGKGYGLYGDRESESGVPGYQYTVYGAGFGVDYHFTDSLLLGLTGGYSDGDINYSGSRDSSDVSATHGGLYGGYEASLWYLDSILTYADLDYETRRFVDLTGERLEGDPQGDMLTGYLEAGLNLWRCGLDLHPAPGGIPVLHASHRQLHRNRRRQRPDLRRRAIRVLQGFPRPQADPTALRARGRQPGGAGASRPLGPRVRRHAGELRRRLRERPGRGLPRQRRGHRPRQRRPRRRPGHLVHPPNAPLPRLRHGVERGQHDPPGQRRPRTPLVGNKVRGLKCEV